MICETCHGEGEVLRDSLPIGRAPPGWSVYQPCPTCGGCGVDHCCDGDQAADDNQLALSAAGESQNGE